MQLTLQSFIQKSAGDSKHLQNIIRQISHTYWNSFREWFHDLLGSGDSIFP